MKLSAYYTEVNRRRINNDKKKATVMIYKRTEVTRGLYKSCKANLHFINYPLLNCNTARRSDIKTGFRLIRSKNT
jgi:hypothetical protein